MTIQVKKAKCVFISFYLVFEDDFPSERMGVSYLISILRKQGHICEMVNIRPGAEQEMVNVIADMQPDFIGLSLAAIDIDRAVFFGHCLRELLGESVHISAGGIFPTYAAKEMKKDQQWSFLNSIILGEGESIINTLIDKLQNDEELTGIPGVMLFSEESDNTDLVPTIQDIDNLPWPVRDQLENVNIPIVTVITSRGCTGRCAFCGIMYNNCHSTEQLRLRSPKSIIDEVEYLHKHYGSETFVLEASTYEDPVGDSGRARVREIADEILNRGLYIFYNITTRASSWNLQDRELLEHMKKSGLEVAFIGFESGSDRMLQLFKKTANIADNVRSIKLFHDASIHVRPGFIMFHPLSEWDDIEKNAQFLFTHFGYQLERFFTELKLYPGSGNINQLEDEDLILPDYYAKFNPNAYIYQDESIGNLSRSIDRMLYYQGRNPTQLMAFMNLCDNIAIYLSRLLRQFDSDSISVDIVEETKRKTNLVYDDVKYFNENLWEEFVTLGRANQEIPLSYYDIIENRFKKANNDIKTLQLRTSLNFTKRKKILKRNTPFSRLIFPERNFWADSLRSEMRNENEQ